MKIVASFSILADITREVAGSYAEVKAIVGPNADAHVYRPTPADAKSVAEADLMVINGLGFDGFMPRLHKAAGRKDKPLVASTGIATLEKAEKGGHAHDHAHNHGKIDPHAWQSIDAIKLYVGNIRDGLAAKDPVNAGNYRTNAEAYLGKLDALKAELQKEFAAIPEANRTVLTNHDSFGYFARDFGFRFEAVQGVSTESEPSAKDIARIIRVAREKKARAVFVENMTDPRIGERLARETGARLGGTLFSDALTEANGRAPTYLTLMRANAQALVGALKP